MSAHIHRRKTCRLCDSEDLKLVFQMEPSPIGDAYVSASRLHDVQETYPIDLFLCNSCGLAQLLDVIAPEVLYRDYLYVTSSSLGLDAHFRQYANTLIDEVRPSMGSLVIDIGSNDGTLLRKFKERGYRVLGIDPAVETAQTATAQGIETIGEFFTPALAERIRQTYGHASIVTANNVFANIDDLATMLLGIRKLLAPDGVFVFESFYLADLLQNLVFDFIYHEHLSAFAVKPVRALFLRIGMELINVKRISTKGGSIRYTAQLEDGQRPVLPIVDDMVDFEQQSGLFKVETYERFTSQIDDLKRQTIDLLTDLKSRGKSIAGFGASITVTTLLYHFGIGHLIDYLVDDNPAKQGTFSPGLHLPVYPGEALFQRKPDFTIILAWRYAEPIAQRYSSYLASGGQFIVPVPELKIISQS